MLKTPERVIVVNTSPLVYLHRAGQLDLLSRLYGEVVVPTSVQEELIRGREIGADPVRGKGAAFGRKPLRGHGADPGRPLSDRVLRLQEKQSSVARFGQGHVAR